MNYPKKELAQLIIEYCASYTITNIVISPGSRNAPLTIGFTNNSQFKTYSIVDERCAAFFALGIAQQTQKPVVLVCTSGSALLNYYPAFAEAFYSNIPLVVISADRPKHLIDIGDGQAIRQENVFQNHCLFDANLTEGSEYELDNRHLINSVLRMSIAQKGPVHINVPFDEPLYETIPELTIDKVEVNSIYSDEKLLNVQNLEPFAKIWNNASRKIILVGEHFPDEIIQKQLAALCEDESILIFTETTSNLHYHQFINSIDKLMFPLNEEQLNKLQPEVLLTFGGMIVSKKVKQFLRKYKPKHHWHVAPKNAPDTYHCLSHHFKITPQLFFHELTLLTEKITSDYQKKWLHIKEYRNKKHTEYLLKTNFSDLKVFDVVLNSLPNTIQLQLGNSSVIRYSQLFDIHQSLKVFCNRGTSGIDGSTSTAIGASLVADQQTVFITGDISFFYDSNALWNTYIKNDFRIILVNNSGGGIFRVIPGPKDSIAADYFETPHNLNAKHLCDMFGFEYASAESEEELIQSLNVFYSTSKNPKLLEIFTPKNENDIILKNYFKYLEY